MHTKTDFYATLPSGNWNLESSSQTPINEGQYKGRTFSVYSSQEKHGWLWKLSRYFAVGLATIFRLGRASQLKTWKAEAKTGLSTKRIKVLNSDGKAPSATSLTPKSDSINKQFSASTEEPAIQQVLKPSPFSVPLSPDGAEPEGPMEDPLKMNPPTVIPQTGATKTVTVAGATFKPFANEPEPVSPIEETIYLRQELLGEGRESAPILLSTLPAGLSGFSPILTLKPKDPSLNKPAGFLTKENAFGREDCQRDVMRQTLLTWRGRPLTGPLSAGSIVNLTGMQLPYDLDKFKALEQRIDNRITLLNESFNFQLRITAHHPDLLAENLTIQDLEDPWDESALKFLLSTDDEISGIVLENLEEANTPRQAEIIVKRLSEMASPKPIPRSTPLDVAALNALTLQQVRSLPAEALDPIIAQLPVNFIKLLTPQQKTTLNIKALSKEQFLFLYDTKAKINNLPSPQFEACFFRLCAENPKQLPLISEQKIKSVNFQTQLFPSEFTMESWPKDKYGHYILNAQQLQDALNKSLFNESTAGRIPSELIKNLDFAKVDWEKAGGSPVISAMLYGPKTIQNVHEKHLKIILHLVSHELLKNLNEAQAKSIDFQTQPFPQGFTMKDWPRDATGYFLTVQQIEHALNRELFNQSTIHLSLDQIKQLNYDKVDWARGVGSTALLKEMLKGRQIQYVPVKHLPVILPFISEDKELMKNLSPDQRKSL